jgi:hypothetical protein
MFGMDKSVMITCGENHAAILIASMPSYAVYVSCPV